jgi:hypothetical protein
MIKHNICVVAVMGAVLTGWSPLAPADTTDALLASQGQFQLDNGETKAVIRGAAVKGYRVCMDEDPDAVPLKVTHDGQETIVEPGECQLIEATKIKLASASRLHEGMTLIGSFIPSSRKSYHTDVSVARTARND